MQEYKRTSFGLKKTLSAQIIAYDETTQSRKSIFNSSQVTPSLVILDKENDQHLQMLINGIVIVNVVNLFILEVRNLSIGCATQ